MASPNTAGERERDWSSRASIHCYFLCSNGVVLGRVLERGKFGVKLLLVFQPNWRFHLPPVRLSAFAPYNR
jgi:hypothetical protein